MSGRNPGVLHKEKRGTEFTAELQIGRQVFWQQVFPFSGSTWLSDSVRFNSHLRHLHLSAALLTPVIHSSINQHLTLTRGEHYGPLPQAIN